MNMMKLTLLAALVAVGGTASNAQNSNISMASTESCITKYRSAPTADAGLEIPTQTRTFAKTLTSTITTCGNDSTTTLTITPAPYTSTVYTNNTSALLTVSGTTTGSVQVSEPCLMTTTISVGIATVYTGTYNNTGPERTASPLDLMRVSRHHRLDTSPKLFHIFGQRLLLSQQRRVAVDCIAQVTTHYIKTSTRFEEPETKIETAATPTVYVTRPHQDSVTPTASTLPTASITWANQVCTVEVAKRTTTQHIKCAPTNMISSINGKGIAQTGGDTGNTRGLAPGSDPSACCQLCVDDETCAASEDDPDASNCFLWYTTPSCGLGFRYSDGDQDLQPGSGFLVQTGCGSVEAVDQF